MPIPLRQRKVARLVSDEAERRAWMDRVIDEELPLSAFSLALQTKLTDMAKAAREPAHV